MKRSVLWALAALLVSQPALADNVSVKDATGATVNKATKAVSGVHFDKNICVTLADTTIDCFTALNASVDGLEGSVDGLEALIGTTNTNTNAISAKLPAALGPAATGASLSIVPATSSTFAITASSLPLPTGAAAEATLSGMSAKLPSALGAQAVGSSFSVTPATSSAWGVTGTFWQTIQPVSLATAPALVASSAVIGKVGIDQTTDGTTNLVAAKQNSTWNITNISGTVSLPTGAATAAKQDLVATGSAAAIASGACTVLEGCVRSMRDDLNAIRNDTSGLPAGTNNIGDVDVLTLPALPAGTNNIGDVDVLSSALPTGASTSAKQPALGTAGSPSADVITIQGSSGMTPVKTSSLADIITTTFTRPPNATAYAAGQTIADSTSAATAGGFTLANACLGSGGTGLLTNAVIIYSGAINVTGTVTIYDSSVTVQNDAAATNTSDADQLKYMGEIPFSTVVKGSSNSTYQGSGLSITYKCVGTTDLRFIVTANAAFTPASGDTFTLRAGVIKN